VFRSFFQYFFKLDRKNFLKEDHFSKTINNSYKRTTKKERHADEGKDLGQGIRDISKILLEIVSDNDLLRQQREEAKVGLFDKILAFFGILAFN